MVDESIFVGGRCAFAVFSGMASMPDNEFVLVQFSKHPSFCPVDYGRAMDFACGELQYHSQDESIAGSW
jgi:hypothetical protein